MLGKAYMSAPEETGLRDFAKAKECFEKVMDGTYSLLPDYNDLWDYTKDAKSEVIFTNTFSCARGYANQVHSRLVHELPKTGLAMLATLLVTITPYRLFMPMRLLRMAVFGKR